jgi:hypothetical protein
MNLPYLRAYVGTKAILKGWKSSLFVNFGQFLAPGSGPAFPIPIRIQESQINADSDPQH